MGKALIDFGLQLAQGAAGMGMGLIGQGIADKRQIKQQRRLQDMQMQGQKEMTEFNYGKQLQMWKDTNYKAQMEQLKMAGLNPGLLYGMGGAGGQSTNITQGNVTGGTAPTGGGEVMGGMGMALNLGLLRAQKENIEADTANKKATTEKTSGVDTKLGETEVGLKTVETELKKIDLAINKETSESKIREIQAHAESALQAADQSRFTTQISEDTYKAQIDEIIQRSLGAALDNEIRKQGLETAKVQIQKMYTDMAQGWVGLEQKDREIKIKQWEAEMNKSFPGLWNVAGRLINGMMENISNAIDKKNLPKYEIKK